MKTVRGARESGTGTATQARPKPRRKGLQLIVHIDGAARGNPGPAGIGVVVQAANGLLHVPLYRYIGKATNNVAEYEALLLALRTSQQLKPAAITVRSDSELLVRQILGLYRVRHPRLAVLYAQALDLIRQLAAANCRFSIEHIGRALNGQADALANQAIDEAMSGVLGEDA